MKLRVEAVRKSMAGWMLKHLVVQKEVVAKFPPVEKKRISCNKLPRIPLIILGKERDGMNIRPIIAAVMAAGLLIPCVVHGSSRTSNNRNKNPAQHTKTNVTWTVESIDIDSATNSSGGGAVVVTNSITLKSSKDDVKKFTIHLSDFKVTMDGNTAHVGDLKAGMKVLDFGEGGDSTTLDRIAVSSSTGSTTDKKKKGT